MGSSLVCSNTSSCLSFHNLLLASRSFPHCVELEWARFQCIFCLDCKQEINTRKNSISFFESYTLVNGSLSFLIGGRPLMYSIDIILFNFRRVRVCSSGNYDRPYWQRCDRSRTGFSQLPRQIQSHRLQTFQRGGRFSVSIKLLITTFDDFIDDQRP